MPQEFSRFARLFIAFTGFAVLAACGGGGGSLGSGDDDGGGPPAPSPTVSLNASATSIAGGQTVTLNWTSANVTSCSASGGWSGDKPTSGSEATGALTATTTFTLTCTGANGSTSANVIVAIVAAPTVTFTAAQSALTENYSTTLSWNAANATSCTASNDGDSEFTGDRPAMGADATGPVSSTTTYTLTCTGLGGTTAQSVIVTTSPPPAGQVVLFGRITFDRLPFNSVAEQGLNASQPIRSPAREVVVQITGVAVPATSTDAGGYYAVNVPVGASVQVRVPARMQKTGDAPTWNFSVLDNADSDALYVLQGAFAVPTANVSRDLHAPSGWTGSGYSAPRFAAPFAILDTVYRAKQLILSAEPTADFPALNLYWSTENRTTDCPDNDPSCGGGSSIPFCPNDGNIGTSFYFRDPSGNTMDECATPAVLPEGIYILGNYASGLGDTDEFDAHVIAHEFGHYFEDRFSRSDSLGGSHTGGDRLDLRVAFGEGWGNAFGAMSLADPQYRDSFQGVSQDFGFNLESDTSNDGWYSEASVGEILWDLFDDNAAASESGDSVALGFAPIYAVMVDEQVNTEAFTSIFSFASALRAGSGSAGAMATLLNRESINGNDEFGSGETNNGGDTRALPVYDTITLNAPKTGICSSTVGGSLDLNKLGNHRFLRFENNAQRLVTISAQGNTTSASTVAATDPDILIYQTGQIVLAGESAVAGRETIGPIQIPAGTYILDVYDFDVSGTNQSPRCMTVSVTGN